MARAAPEPGRHARAPPHAVSMAVGDTLGAVIVTDAKTESSAIFG